MQITSMDEFIDYFRIYMKNININNVVGMHFCIPIYYFLIFL